MKQSKSSHHFILLFIVFFLSACPLFAKKLLVAFSSTMNSNDILNTNYDLFSAHFDDGKVSNIQQLTDTPDATEFFPSLSPDRNWIAYNYQVNHSNEIRLINLESKVVTSIFAGGRFPEWIDNSSLLVTQVRADSQDVFKLELDLSTSIPKVEDVQQITNRENCPGTRMASDAYPFADGEMLLFHMLRPDQSGAALATIHMDGSDFRQLTEWNGSGHGIITKDGKYVVSGNSQSGKAVLLHVQQDTTLFSFLPLLGSKSDVVAFDPRFAQVPVVGSGYPAWGADERSVFFSLKGLRAVTGEEISRIIYAKFDENWQNPQIIDFASEIENATGSSGNNFSTASARVMPDTSLENGVLYIAIVMHNEDWLSPNYPNYATNREAYLASRKELLNFCEMLHTYEVPFSWESDWTFLQGVLNWDSGSVLNDTNGKNLVRYMHEDLGVTIDPHSHQNLGYNYADVACLIDSLGVEPTNVIGGHTWDPDHPKYSDWEQYREPVSGAQYPWYTWKGDILMGASGGGHDNDTAHSGVWRPKDKYHFWQDDPNGTIYSVGQYRFGNTLDDFQELIDLYRTGEMAPDQILTANKIIGQHVLDSTWTADFEQNMLLPLLAMQERGEVKLATFGQIIEDWKTIYQSKPNLYFPDAPTKVELQNENLLSGFELAQNYPNPFNPETTIPYCIAQASEVRLAIYDVNGRLVRTLVQQQQSPGNYTVTWNGRDNDGRNCASGVYFYRLHAGDQTITRQLVLIR